MEVPNFGRLPVASVPAIPGDTTSNPVRRPLQRRPAERVNDPLMTRQGLSDTVARQVNSFLKADRFASAVRPRRLGIRVSTFQSLAFSERLTDTLKRLPATKAEVTIGGRLPAEWQEIAPVYRCPVITEPLSNGLRAFAADAILTDASRIPPDTVAIFEENRRFIEGFLVGAAGVPHRHARHDLQALLGSRSRGHRPHW